MFSPIEKFAKQYINELLLLPTHDTVTAYHWYAKGYTDGVEKAIAVQKEIAAGNKNFAPDTIDGKGTYVAGVSTPSRKQAAMRNAQRKSWSPAARAKRAKAWKKRRVQSQK